ncbi:MAG TPA: FmdB family zinc ribbon protein [Segeticoccus sp.]|jgi:putative FmdB family regulatory protein|nr:FmdB family zinc ribbon protein [Segeticoccus sp.]
MPTYSYRCHRCGDFDVTTPMHQRPERANCPSCGRARGRVFTAPSLRSTSRALDAQVERAGRSAEAPEVVRSIPAAALGGATPRVRDGRYPPLPRS